jgi:hypothetical protein
MGLSYQGVSPMNKFLATMLQTIQNYAPPPPVDNGSIWQHMSEALRQSLFRVLSLLIAVLPGILAIFVALTLFTIIGMLLSGSPAAWAYILKI